MQIILREISMKYGLLSKAPRNLASPRNKLRLNYRGLRHWVQLVGWLHWKTYLRRN